MSAWRKREREREEEGEGGGGEYQTCVFLSLLHEIRDGGRLGTFPRSRLKSAGVVMRAYIV